MSLTAHLFRRSLREAMPGHQKRAFQDLDKSAQQALGPDGAPVDPMAAGGAPMDPAAAGGAPMDPAMMDPAAAGGAPVDPAAEVGLPPTDESIGEPPPDMMDPAAGTDPDAPKAVTTDEADIVMGIVERTLEAVGKKKTPGAGGKPGEPAAPAPAPEELGAGPVTGMPGDLSALAGGLGGMNAPKLASILGRKRESKTAGFIRNLRKG